MPLSEYLAGLAQLVAVVAAVLVGAAWLVRRAEGLAGPPRRLAVGVVATAGLVAVHVVPAALTILSRLTVLVAAAVWLGAAWVLRGRRDDAPREAPPGPPPRAPLLSRLLATAAALALTAVALAIVSRDRVVALTALDMVNFHLPGVARWLQSGSIWQINQFGPDLAHGNYPHNGDFVLLATMLPWDSDFLVRAAMLPFTALTALAVYCGGRELRAPATTAALVAAAVVALPIAFEGLVHDALPDPVLYSSFAAGIAFLLRHHRTGARSDLVLAGVGLAVAFGTKWYGVGAVPIVVVVWALARLVARRGPRTVAAQFAGVTSLVVAGGAAWLARNWAESGNPFFPVEVELAGVTLLDAPRDVYREQAGFRIAEYLGGDAAVWREHLLPILRDFLGLPAAALAVLVVVGVVAAVRERGERRILPLGVCSLLLLAFYVSLPYSAQGGPGLPVFAGFNTRYAMPAILVAAPVAAWVAVRFPRARLPIEALLAASVVDGIAQRLDVPVARSLAVAAVLVVLALGAAALLRARPPVRTVAAGAAALLAAVAVVVVGHRTQADFHERRYTGFDATFDWVRANAPAGARIALAGDWSRGVGAPLPMFGPRLENEVEFLGRWEEEMLRRHPDQRAFARAFAAGGFDLLLVGRGFAAAPGDPPARDVREEVWARQAGLVEVARSDVYTLFAPAGR